MDAAERGTFERRPIEERDTYSAAFLQRFNLWRVDDAVRCFVFAPRFGKAAADLLGVSGVRIYHDRALFKEPGGGHTPWHQDQFSWPLDTEKTITMWMRLADLDPRVGSMTFADGSHVSGKLRGHAISDESEAEFAGLVESEHLFADSARVSEPDSAYQQFDLSVWLPGLNAGDLAASPINPRLWPTSDSREMTES